MSWLNLSEDIAAEFDQQYLRRTLERLDAWQRISNSARCKRAYSKREDKIVAQRRCQCGKSFLANKNRPRKKVCASSCKFMRQRPPELFWNGQAVSDLARLAGVQYQTMKYRFRAGWPFELALSTPNRSRRVVAKLASDARRR
jgi:hypothetical protein